MRADPAITAESRPTEIHFGGAVQIVAGDGDGAKLPRFEMVAYTGGPMKVPELRYPVIIDLTTLRGIDRSRPILRNHDKNREVGHTERFEVVGSELRVSGVLSVEGADRDSLTTSSRNGFPWQASVGGDPGTLDFVRAGATVVVNGRTHRGPVYVSRNTNIKEVSFVPLGADDNTNARVAARAGGSTMPFEQWVKTLGLDATKLTAEQETELRASYEARFAGADDNGDGDNPDVVGRITPQGVTAADGAAVVQGIRAQAADETDRIAQIRALCGNDNTEIAAQAIREGWSRDRTEVTLLRQGRPTIGAPAAGGPAGPGVNQRVLECATLLALGYDEDRALKEYGEQTINATDQVGMLGLRELTMFCAKIDGADLPIAFGDGRTVIQAATSGHTLSSLASNVAEKMMLATFNELESAAVKLAKAGRVSDFKTVERWGMDGMGQWKPVAKDGQLKHGTASDRQYTNKAETHGLIFGISRNDIINDNIGVMEEIPRMLAMGAYEVRERLFFQLLLGGVTSGFYASGNSNLLTGANSALGDTGLTNALAQFQKLRSGPGSDADDERYISVPPKILAVPPELEKLAQEFMTSREMQISSTSKRGTANTWAGKFDIVSSPYLSDSRYAGYSATAWYLFANPNLVPAYEIVYVNGRRTPIIERVPAPSDQLAVQWRGYWDIGVGEMQTQGAQRNAGT